MKVFGLSELIRSGYKANVLLWYVEMFVGQAVDNGKLNSQRNCCT